MVELLGSCKLICVPLLVCESANTDLLLLGTFSVGGLAYDVYSGPGTVSLTAMLGVCLADSSY